MQRAAFVALVVALTLTAAPVRGWREEPHLQLVGEVRVAYGNCSIIGAELNLTAPGAGVHGRRLLRFVRVPYAEPPVGALRFAAPQPFDFGQTDCLVNASVARPASAAEDLLHISIRTPDLTGRLPVLVLFLDGSPDGGVGHELGDAFAADVVMATVGSRAGVLGNLPAGHNNGLSDQRLALRFLRDALPQFGGDPTRLTLAGHGPAAAAAVGLHAVGAVGDAAFSRVVMLSGSIAAPLAWSASTEAAAALDRRLAEKLCSDLGDIGQLPLDCLRNRTLDELLEAEQQLLRERDGSGRFAPSFNASTLLPDALWRRRHFNGSLMIGAGAGAGLALAEQALQRQGVSDWSAVDQGAFEAILDREFGQFPRLHSAGASVSGRRYLRLSLSGWPVAAFGAAARPALSRALSDFNAACPVWRAASDLTEGGGGEVFVYQFDGADGEAADAAFLMGEPLLRPAEFPPELRNLSAAMMRHLADFVSTGAPGPDWFSSSALGAKFMRFSATNGSAGASLASCSSAFGPGRCPLWSDEMLLANSLSSSASPSPPPAPMSLPPPPQRAPSAAAQVLSNVVLRNFTITPAGFGPLLGQTVRTPAGKVMTEFLGVPYAKPPVGDRRFKLPEPVDRFTEQLLTLSPKPACPQSGPLASVSLDATSEDCLYLNLWTPLHPDRELRDLPILVFFHGGFFQGGDVIDERWRGSHLVDRADVLVVTAAYRLGVLGFLWLNGSVPANLGLRDQAMALSWVRSRIRSFGGNNARVTVMGVEAGAVSVGFHLLEKPLPFQRAVLLSGSPNLPYAVSPRPELVLQLHRNFTAGYLNCSHSDLDCLRSLNASDIVNAAADFQRDAAADLPVPFVLAFGPALDGDFLKEDPSLAEAPVPLLLGGADAPGNELARLLLGDRRNVSRLELLEHLGRSLQHFPRFGETLSSVGRDAVTSRFAEFPSSAACAGVREARLLAEALGDRHFTCPAWKFMARAANSSAVQVFSFLLAEPAEDRQTGDSLTGASLFDDAHFAMGRPATPSKPLGEARASLSAFLADSLLEFVNSSSVSWEPYSPGTQRVLLLRDSGTGGNVTWPPRYVAEDELRLRGLDCAFWDETLGCVDSPGCINATIPEPTTTPKPTTGPTTESTVTQTESTVTQTESTVTQTESTLTQTTTPEAVTPDSTLTDAATPDTTTIESSTTGSTSATQSTPSHPETESTSRTQVTDQSTASVSSPDATGSTIFSPKPTDTVLPSQTTGRTGQTAPTNPTAATKLTSEPHSSALPTKILPGSTPAPDTGGGLQTWAIVLIVIGSVLGAALLVGAGFLIFKCCSANNAVGAQEGVVLKSVR